MTRKPHKYEVGQVFSRWTPFIVEDRDIPDFGGETSFGTVSIKSWRPGVRYENVAPDDAEPVWDGEGMETRTIVAIAHIDGGGLRILYRREWQKPDGKTFGKKTVRLTTPSAFTVWGRGHSLSFIDERMRVDRASESLAVARGFA